MDPVSLNNSVIKAIKEVLPEEANLFLFLSDVLPLNKEAVYRRLRGEVAFSFLNSLVETMYFSTRL